MDTKQCTKCKKILPLSEFYNRSESPTGKRGTCKKCMDKQELSRRTKKRERYMFINVKCRAKKKGIPFDIELEDIYIPSKCPVLGIELKKGKGTICKTSPSIDRFIPEKGYVKGNVTVISNLANTIKSDATPEQVQMVADWMKQQQQEIANVERNKRQ